MLKNYLKIALRNIKDQKGYSFINIVSLAIGLTCCMLILLYIQYEFSYDKYHDDAQYIYCFQDQSWIMDICAFSRSGPDHRPAHSQLSVIQSRLCQSCGFIEV